ncbi:hypothetical protein D3C84_840390 [compost metagenome]
MANVGRCALQQLAEPVSVLAVAVRHDGHRGPLDQRSEDDGGVEVRDDDRIGLRKAFRAGKVAAAVDHADVPAQQFAHAHQWLGVVAGAEDHQARGRSHVLEEHFDFSTGIGVEPQRGFFLGECFAQVFADAAVECAIAQRGACVRHPITDPHRRVARRGNDGRHGRGLQTVTHLSQQFDGQ